MEESKGKNEEDRKKVIKITDNHNEFFTDVDGFVYYWPKNSPHGCLASHHLRWIADELDKRNVEWKEQINDYLSIFI